MTETWGQMFSRWGTATSQWAGQAATNLGNVGQSMVNVGRNSTAGQWIGGGLGLILALFVGNFFGDGFLGGLFKWPITLMLSGGLALAGHQSFGPTLDRWMGTGRQASASPPPQREQQTQLETSVPRAPTNELAVVVPQVPSRPGQVARSLT